jgi:hypothetical protein
MKPKLILGLAIVLGGGLFGCSESKSTNVNTATLLQNTFQKIEKRVPELACIGSTNGIPGSGEVWHGEEYADAAFVLRKSMILRPAGEFPQNANAGPNVRPDISIVITRYASSGDAQKDVQKSFFLRQSSPELKGTYKGAALYEDLGESGEVLMAICQSGQYVVEVNPDSEQAFPLVMKVMDVVLAELHSN